MGFGIRVPGLRISTRGVRVGPRFASVGVSTRGRVSGSVGPRIARVSVSPRGVRVGTGLGPVGVSVGRGGVRGYGGVGPVFGSVGKSGVVVGAGLGPVWAAKGLGGGSRTRSGGRSSGHGRMDLSTEYATYKAELTRTGGARRSRDELRIAAINAFYAPLNYLVVPFERFTPPAPRLPTESDLQQWALNQAIRQLLASGVISAPPTEIPLPPSRDEVEPEIVKALSDQGKVAPVHPARKMGFRNDRMPDDSEIRSWVAAEMNLRNSWWKRTFRKSQVVMEAEQLGTQVVADLQKQVSDWTNENLKYRAIVESQVQQRLNALHEKYNEQVAAEQPVREVINKTVDSLRKIQQDALGAVEFAYQQFVNGDPVYTTLVLQAVLSDNAGSAAPIGIDGDDALIAMTAPPSSEVIWPEEWTVNTNLSVRKKTKTDIDDDYFWYLLSHVTATARETFSVVPKIMNVRVVVLDEKDTERDFFKRRILAEFTISRNEMESFDVNALETSWGKAGLASYQTWNTALASGDINEILACLYVMEANALQDQTELMKGLYTAIGANESKFRAYIGSAKKNQPRLSDLTDSTVNTSDEIQIIESEDMDLLRSLDIEADEVSTPDFWLLCQEVAQNWDAEEIDVEQLKQQITEWVELLYPIEPADILVSNEKHTQ